MPKRRHAISGIGDSSTKLLFYLPHPTKLSPPCVASLVYIKICTVYPASLLPGDLRQAVRLDRGQDQCCYLQAHVLWDQDPDQVHRTAGHLWFRELLCQQASGPVYVIWFNVCFVNWWTAKIYFVKFVNLQTPAPYYNKLSNKYLWCGQQKKSSNNIGVSCCFVCAKCANTFKELEMAAAEPLTLVGRRVQSPEIIANVYVSFS